VSNRLTQSRPAQVAKPARSFALERVAFRNLPHGVAIASVLVYHRAIHAWRCPLVTGLGYSRKPSSLDGATQLRDLPRVHGATCACHGADRVAAKLRAACYDGATHSEAQLSR
jgi:hypothetical protein